MTRTILLIIAIAALSAAVPDPDEGPNDPQTIVVEMVEKGPTDFVFEPAEITVRPGDVVRFVQTGVQPHNVEFRDVPTSADLDAVLMGPFLTRKGESYEIEIDRRFVAGRYEYVCTPHVSMGMRGAITVQGEARTHSQMRSEP